MLVSLLMPLMWHQRADTNKSVNSLLKPEKYAARRSHKDGQGISVITTERRTNQQGSSMRGNNTPGNVPRSPRETLKNYYDRDNRHTQVKTYTDQGNGYNQRSGSTTLYSKVGKLIIAGYCCESLRNYLL